MYKAKILADSLSPQGKRLTTMKITFPRMMLAELNTHRTFSRNSASSRAIPFKKMVKMVEENPFIPIAWQRYHKGMQGTEYFTDEKSIEWKRTWWLEARDKAVESAKVLSNDNVTKQLCNRLLEPFMWHTVIVSSTSWENFFKLRCPEYECRGRFFRSKKDLMQWSKDDIYTSYTDLDFLQINKSQADIHIQAIAELMWDAYNESEPKQLQAGEWHIPFGDNLDDNVWEVLSTLPNGKHTSEDYTIAKVKIATARCARISYQTLGDNPKIDYEADIRLHDMLAESGHWSPFEHVARAMSDEEFNSFVQGELSLSEFARQPNENKLGWCRNFQGFIQYRHLVD